MICSSQFLIVNSLFLIASEIMFAALLLFPKTDSILQPMFSQVYENSQFSLLAMELGRTQRLKTLEHVSVHGLEEALEKGFTIAACLHYHDFISFISLSLKKNIYIY